MANMMGFHWDADIHENVTTLAKQLDAFGDYLSSLNTRLTGNNGLSPETFTKIPGADQYVDSYKAFASNTSGWANNTATAAHAAADALMANLQTYQTAEQNAVNAAHSVPR
jgi:hypothetical protein